MISTEQKLDREISLLLKGCKGEKTSRRMKSKVTYNEFFLDKMLMISIIQQGVPYSLFDLIKNITPFSESDWADFLDISTKSLQRYKQNAKHFKPIQSEKIIEMAEVTNIGQGIFGSSEKLKLWLNTPNFALGNLKPIELLKDSYGKEMVIAELTRIEHGIFV